MPTGHSLPDVTLPRLFWPLALLLAAIMAATLLLAPISLMLAHGSTNYNEGWNAYHQQEASQGRRLYGEPPGLVCNNYPPVSFHLIALASRLTGDMNQTGRWVAFLSLFLVAALCGAIVLRFTISTPLAVYTALSVIICLAVYKPDRIGMNDPQLLGTVFSLLGLYSYIRWPEKSGWLVLSALAFTISVFTKHNLLAFPAAVGLHLLLRRMWKGVAVWGGAVAFGSALLLALTQWKDGPYFFANLLIPRTRLGGLDQLTVFATMFQLPLAIGVVWALRDMAWSSMRHIMALSLLTSLGLALGFAGVAGVDTNIFFDSIFSLVIVGSLVFAEFAPYAAKLERRGILLVALLLAPATGIAVNIPRTLQLDWQRRPFSLHLYWAGVRARDFDYAVGLLRGRPGPALCEDLLLCFEAGKPFLYDPFFTMSMSKVGRVKEDDLVALVENHTFRTVQLNLSSREPALRPGERPRFTARFMDALLRHYRTEARLSDYVVLIPNE